MIIEFSNLNENERQQLLSLEEKFPEEIVVRDIVAGFDGETAMQLITQLGPAIITSLSVIIVAIINRKDQRTGYETYPRVVIVMNDGDQKAIESAEDIKKLEEYEQYREE